MAAAAEERKDEGEAVEEEVKGIKMSEVEQHSSIDDLWLVIDGRGQWAYTSRASLCVCICTRCARRVSFKLFFVFSPMSEPILAVENNPYEKKELWIGTCVRVSHRNPPHLLMMHTYAGTFVCVCACI